MSEKPEKIVGNEVLKKILVIDDEAVVREVLGRVLKAAGFQPLFAGDGFEGLEMAVTWRPDLIVLDVRMPHMNGYSLCSILKKDSRTSGIPVLMVTARDKIGDAEESFQQGADGYLSKPLEFSRFLAKVGELLK